MAKNYYICRGYNVENYYECNLSIVFNQIKSLVDIDYYTSRFNNYNLLKEYFLKIGYIKSPNEDVVIGYYNHGRLVPLFLREMIFREDLIRLNLIDQDVEQNLELTNEEQLISIAEKLWEFIKTKQNDSEFIGDIISTYLNNTYDHNIKECLVIIDNYLKSNEYATDHKDLFCLAFSNFFTYELFKTDIVEVSVRDQEGYTRRSAYKVAKDKKLNAKGFHDMLLLILDYCKQHNISCSKSDYANDFEIVDSYPMTQFKKGDEFLDERDYDLLIKNYAYDPSRQIELDSKEAQTNKYIQAALEEKRNIKR